MTKLWKFAVVAALVAAFGALAAAGLGLPAEEAVPRDYQCDVYTEQGCAKMVVASGGELEVQSGGELEVLSGGTVDFQSGATVGLPEVSVTTGGISVTGGVTVTSGGIVVTGTSEFNDNVDMLTNELQNIGNAGTDFDVNGGLSTASHVTVTGYVTATGNVYAGGTLMGRTNVISKAASYTLLAAESGSLCSNVGASGALSWTLPTAATGLNYCFYVGPTQPITLVVGAADMVHHLTNAAGDRVMNGTAGSSFCITAIDSVLWIPSQEVGTWEDAD